ncbi:MAG: hypothetical protein OHK0040_01350 [bacterium]
MQEKWESPFYKILTFFFLSAIFFLLRLDTFKYVYAKGYLKLIDPDSYYHLRRILYTCNNYPKMLNFDSFLSYPAGDYVPWPPLFDFLSATIAIIFGKPLVLLPFFDMFYFFAAFSIIYWCSLREYGSLAATIIAFLLAVAGILRVYTSFGRLDHHALELLIITASYVSFLAYYRKKGILLMLLFTLTVLAAFFNWPGSVIYYPPLMFFVFYKLFKKEVAPDLFKGLFVTFHITAIVIAIYLRLTKTADYPPYSYKFLSSFQRDFCFFVSIIFFNIYLTMKTKIHPAVIWTIALIILFGAFHKFVFELFHGFSYVGKTNSVFILAEETTPLFFGRFYTLGEELKRALSLFTPLLFLLPFVFYSYVKKRGFDTLFFYTVYFFCFTLFQLRFGYFFMLGYVVMTGVAFQNLLVHIKKPLIYIAMTVISVFLFYSNYKEAQNRFESRALYDALQFLKEGTPNKDDFSKGAAPYGLLSSWHLGHYIIALGERPAVAHNFIGVSKNNDERAFITALFSKDEQEVIEIMNKKKAKFLFLDDPKSLIITDWAAISSDPNPYINDNNALKSNVLELFLYRLYSYNGLTPPFDKTPQHLRLIYENNEIKIFEFVKGVKIKAKPQAILKAKIVTPVRTFFYISQGVMSKEGKEFIFPYSLDAPYPVRAKEVYIEENGIKQPIKVLEEMVQ